MSHSNERSSSHASTSIAISSKDSATWYGNLLEQAINCSDGDHAAKIIQNALGIESDEVANYVFPQTWPTDREQRARIIGEWLQTGFLA